MKSILPIQPVHTHTHTYTHTHTHTGTPSGSFKFAKILSPNIQEKFSGKRKRIYQLLYLLSICIVLSCTKEEFSSDRNQQSRNVVPRSVSSELDFFAAALAVAQADPNIRGFIKRHAFGNPYDDNCAIYALIKDEIVNGDPFHEVLYDNRDQSRSGFDSDFFDQDVLEDFPSLSIYVYPGDDEDDVIDWDTTVNTGVFALPDSFSSAFDSISVYDDNLDVYKIHPINEPTDPYLIISENSVLTAINLDTERMSTGDSVEYRLGIPPPIFTCEDFWEALNDDIEGGIYFTVNGVDYLLISETTMHTIFCAACEPEWVGCDGGVDGGGGEGCDRDQREERDELVKYTFPSQNLLRKTCHWSRNRCQFQINAIYAQNPNSPAIATLQKSHLAYRRNLKGFQGRFQTVPPGDIDFLKWDLDNYGDPMKYVWIYSHPRAGEKIETTISLGVTFKPKIGPETEFSGSIKITIEEKDILLDEDAVYYCDDADGQGTDYSTGTVRFFIKEHEPD